MFRFNNPDALLTLLLVGAAYATDRVRSKRGRTSWLVLGAASFVGFGFLTKMLQALPVVPGFALVYLIAAPTPVRRRLAPARRRVEPRSSSPPAGGSRSSRYGPPSSRPYIGGSQDNSILSLIFGYNGFGRLTGNETGSVVGGQTFGGGGGPQPRGGMWGPTGITRLFDSRWARRSPG